MQDTVSHTCEISAKAVNVTQDLVTPDFLQSVEN